MVSAPGSYSEGPPDHGGHLLTSLGIDDEDERVYLAVLRAGQISAAQLPTLVDRPPAMADAAVTRLVAKGLILPGNPLRPVSPDVAIGAVLADWEVEVERGRARQAHLRTVLPRLMDALAEGRRTQAAVTTGELILDRQLLGQRLEELAHQARYEVLSLIPNPVMAALNMAAPMDLEALGRGVTLRSLYPRHVLDDPAIREYMRGIRNTGEQNRFAEHLPMRMLIVDRQTAVVPADPTDESKGALIVSGTGLPAGLRLLFEYIWDDALPADELGAVESQLDQLERGVLRCLANGMKDETAARSLDLSVRTFRRQVAAVLEKLGADSRFAAGARAAERGWLRDL